MTGNGKKIKVGGSDTVGVDIVIPRSEVLEEKLQDFPSNLAIASKLHDEMQEIVCTGYNPGNKYSGSENDRAKLMPLYVEYKEAIQPSNLELIFVGTTIANKLHYLKTMAQDKVETILFSAVGNDEFGNKIRTQLKNNGIILADNGEALEGTRINFVVTPKGAKDRIINKFPYKAPPFFNNLESQIKNATSCDIYLLESSQRQYFNQQDYKAFLNTINNSGPNLVFAPPTDTKFFRYKDDLIETSNQSKLTIMNETEAIWFTGNPNFDREITSKKDPDLSAALLKLHDSLKDHPDTTMVVTAGAIGAFVITKDLITLYDGKDVPMVMNKAGAGDCAAGMAIYELMIKNRDKVTEKIAEQTGKLIVDACTIKILCPETQVDPEIMRNALNGKIPFDGVIEKILPTELRRFKG